MVRCSATVEEVAKVTVRSKTWYCAAVAVPVKLSTPVAELYPHETPVGREPVRTVHRRN
jgi:hypothetical protein